MRTGVPLVSFVEWMEFVTANNMNATNLGSSRLTTALPT